MANYAVILCGGSGSRMGAGENKIFLKLCGVPALVRATAPFTGYCAGCVVVAAAQEQERVAETLRRYGLSRFVKKVVQGGATRQESVWNGLCALPEDAELVLIHDGARALVPEKVIADAIACAKIHGSAVAAIPSVDTIKQAQPDGLVTATPDRSSLYAVQTPQVFPVETILAAHRFAQQDGFLGTDDASLLEHMGQKVYLSSGSRENLKLTTPVDLAFAEAILNLREKEENPE